MNDDRKYMQVHDYLLELIRAPETPGGGKLPSEAALAARFAISRGTVQRAISELTREGLLHRRRGSGTYIARRESPSGRLIGLVTPHMCDLDNVYHRAMAAAEEVFRQAGYGVFSCSTPNEREAKMVIANADGILYCPVEGENSDTRNNDFARAVLTGGKAMVLVDKSWPGELASRFPCVGSSNEKAAYDLVSYLLKRGLRRIAMIHTRTTSGEARLAGYRRALAQYGIEPAEEYVWCAEEPRLRDAGSQAANLLAALARPPEVIFCVNDDVAFNVIRKLRQRRVRIPEEIGVVGFDNNSFSEMIDPPLSTVCQNAAEIGAVAARMLLEKLANPNLECQSREIDCKIVIRESLVFPQTVEIAG